MATFLPRTYRNLESTRGERHPRRILWGGALTFIVTVSGKQWFLQRFTQYPIANERFPKKQRLKKHAHNVSSRNILLKFESRSPFKDFQTKFAKLIAFEN